MRYPEIRRQIVDMCLRLEDLRFFLGTWGNVSVRQGEHILLTPSKVCYQTMTPEDIVIIDLDGNRVEGERNPTSEKEVHRQIYLAREDVGAVIHAHTPYAMAASAGKICEVPCLVEEMSQLLGGGIPVTETYVPAEQHARLGEIAAKTMGAHNGVILRNHGPVAAGRNLEDALLACQVVEKACQIYAAARVEPLLPIPEQAVQSEHYRYFTTYGHENT